MDASAFCLRAAADGDCGRTLAWANDPETRKASFHSEPISEAAHSSWFADSLAGARDLYIVEQNGTPVGVVRLDPSERNDAIVSLTIAPEHRGRGLGSTALMALADRAAYLGYSRLLAKIRKTNIRSQRVFERAGFEQCGEEIVHGVPALLYALEPQTL